MPLFEYQGLTAGGKNTRGTIDADNSRTAKLRLKKQGIYVVTIKDRSLKKKRLGAKSVSQRSVGVKDLSLMTRQLSTLLKASIPLVDSLGAVSEQVENEMLSETMAEIKNMVNEGATLHRSLAKYPKIFNKIYISMCEAGEMSGNLDVILIRLSEFTESQNELRSKIKSAMIYPIIMMLFSLGMLVLIFIYVIPRIVVVFEATPELTLPWFTVALIDLSHFLTAYWYLLVIGGVLGYFFFRNWKETPSGRKQWDFFILVVPVVGKLARLIAVSRFARTLSTLLTGGVPMLLAMDIVRNVVSNEILAAAIETARDNISEGESIAGPLKKSGQFPPMVLHMINIGEKTGELERMLTQVSDSYDFQVSTEVEGLTAIIAPAMIVVMGGVIAVIVFAILIPLFDLMNLGG